MGWVGWVGWAGERVAEGTHAEEGGGCLEGVCSD